MDSEVKICELLDNSLVETHFQPLISAHKQSAVGLEALSRGIHPNTGQLVPPQVMFNLAEELGLTVELDRLCRETALKNFCHIHRINRDMCLFLNLDTSIMDWGVVGSGHLINTVNKLGLNPSDVIIEVIETKVDDNDALKQFIRTYREYGFMIALDDVGYGSSNLDRILHARPDILKLDRWLIKDVDKDYYKREVFKSLVSLSKKIGALVVAEGIETKEEAVTSLELGADLLQGYYFAKPQKIVGESDGWDVHDRIGIVAPAFKESKAIRIAREKQRCELYGDIIYKVLAKLTRLTVDRFEQTLVELVKDYSTVEYLYILNKHGVQITASICDGDRPISHRNRLFKAACEGADQSLKDYYLYVRTVSERYTTEPYISLATGNLCVTSSALFRNAEDEEFILCMDFNCSEINGDI